MMNAAEQATHRIEHDQRLDSIAQVLETSGSRLDDAAGSVLGGDVIGHPAHPPLTDLPIGFWTSAFVLDFIGGRRSRAASQRLIGLGILTVVPTAAAGLVDWHRMHDPGKRRVGVVHSVSNSVATLLYIASWRSRRRDRHLAGVLLGVLGATAATVGGYLGGHIAFGSSETSSDTSSETADRGETVAAGVGDVELAAPQPEEDHSLEGKIGG